MLLTTINIVKYRRAILELVFVSFFLYLSFPLINYSLVLRIWAVTALICALFAIKIISFDRGKNNSLKNLTIIFFIIFSITHAAQNITTLKGPYAIIYEAIHYLLTLFILTYNFNKLRLIETGLVLFIAYSFRIFDSSLFANEFTLLHALSVILALLFVEGVYFRKNALSQINSIFISAGALITVIILSTLNAACPYNSLAQMAIMINFIFIAFVIAIYIKDINQIKLIISSFFFMGIILFILIMNEIMHSFLKGGIKFITPKFITNKIWIDITTPFRIHPNSIAGYFSVLLCLVISSLRFYKKGIISVCIKLSLIIMSAILLLTYSRLGIFSFICAVAILFILRYKEALKFIKNRITSVFLAIFLIAAVIFFTPIKQNIINKFRPFSDTQTFYSCWISLNAIRDRPLFGFGLDNYYMLSKYAKEQVFDPSGAGIEIIRNVIFGPSHSMYIGMAFGMGTIGLLIFVWLSISITIYFINLNRNIPHTKYESSLLQGIFAGFISVLIHGTLSMTFHLTILPAFFWVFIGLIIAIGNLSGFNRTVICQYKPLKYNILIFLIFLSAVLFVINPIIAEKRYGLALNSFKLGELDKAQTFINQAVRFMPFNPKLYELKAEIKASNGGIAEAIELYKKALSLKREFAFYHTRLGQLYWRNKMHHYAFMEVNRAIDLDKYGVCYQEHYSDLGNFYQAIGEREKAIAQFKMAFSIIPKLSCDTSWKGNIYLEDILKEAWQEYSAVKDTNPLLARQILYNLNRADECRKKD